MKAKFHSQMLKYRQPFGAVSLGTAIRFCVEAQGDDQIYCLLRYRTSTNLEKENFLPMKKMLIEDGMFAFECTLLAPYHPCLIWYDFVLRSGEAYWYISNAKDRLGGMGLVTKSPVEPFQVTVYRKMQGDTDWFDQGVMYQIFVDRFNQGSQPGNYPRPVLMHTDWNDFPYYVRDEKGRIVRYDFFGGTLNGILEKLEYLHDLGITILYLNPIFESASNHKYDTADYFRVDPNFGEEDDLIFLCKRAEELGISLVLDGVFSHVGSDSRYFNREKHYPELGAYHSKQSPYYSWFKFRKHPDDYEAWWGIDTMPNVNEEEPTYQSFILDKDTGVLSYWMERGIRGWRLDVADELPDSFIKGIQHRVKNQDSGGIVIGEVWEDASNKISYEVQREYLYGEELDSVMNYPFQQGILRFLRKEESGRHFLRVIKSIHENYPPRIFSRLMNFLGTHDTLRSLNAMIFHDEPYTEKSRLLNRTLTEEERALAFQRLRIAVMLLFTLPGIPCVYYGDEAGLEGWKDPFNRRTYPWGREDQKIMSLYRHWIELYHSVHALRIGSFTPGEGSERGIAFMRQAEGEQVYCIANAGEKPWVGQFPIDGIWENIETGERSKDVFHIPGGTAELYIKREG